MMHAPFFHSLRLTVWFLAAALPLCAQSTPLTVQLDWKPTAQFAGILAADAEGYYAAEHLNVTILPADDATHTVPLVAAHTNWIGIAEADVLLVEVAKGEHVKAFATMMQSTPFALLTLKQSGLTTIKSLRGKTIGLHGDGQKAIDVLLQFNGMTRQDVTIVDTPYSTAPLLNGTVDAIQGYIIDEAVALDMEHHPVYIIPMSGNGYVSYAEVLFASDALLARDPNDLVRFLRATGRGWEFAAAHPDETAGLIVTRYLHESTVAEQKASLLAVLPLLHTESSHFGAMLPDTWARSLQMFQRYQLVNRALHASEAVDYTILDKLYTQ
jgi:ABC-type nitrate/sulfonate/bicarbonate transport system substrate-binding protein